jgi:multiple sugar transport system permease protein
MLTQKWRSSKTNEWVGPMAKVSATYTQDITEGKISMWFSYTNDLVLASVTADINPQLLGIAQMPAGPAGHANEVNAGMWAINATIKDPKKIEACWRFIKYFVSDEAARINTEKFVELGFANLVNPIYLKKFGYEDLASAVDPRFLRANEELFKTGHPEPYGRNCQQIYAVLDGALDRAVLEPHTPSSAILKHISSEIDRKLLGYTPPEILQKQRAWAFGFLLLFTLCAAGFSVPAIRRIRLRSTDVSEKMSAGASRKRIYRFVYLCIAPAVLSLLVWAYYPLIRGLVIAFQDYRLLHGSHWVGLDNFISVFTQPIFYKSVYNSFLFVGLSITIGFFIPIFLALALSEISKFRALFTLIFYLPAMTSSIVVALLWGQFYDPSEVGLLNRMLSPFIDVINGFAVTFLGYSSPPIEKAINWLGNPSLAMFAVVLPGIWAAAGPGSMLYLAALKNIPQERYEAADIDGASWMQKIRYLTLPGLKPLIIINLLGVFVAGFKSMESIFVLTGGGPLNATHTIGLEIWTNAFMFLNFGYATAAAWVMGAILIGFTVLQIKNLLRMRFTQSSL